MNKPPKMIAPQTPLSAPQAPTPEDERKAAMAEEREAIRKYGGKGRASTVLTGQGASNSLG